MLISSKKDIELLTSLLPKVDDRLKLPQMIYNMNNYKFNLKYNNIELKKSDIHGFGVFATKNIPKGAIITQYQTYAVRDKQTNLVYYNNDGNTNSIKDFMDEYLYDMNDFEIIGNPNKIDNTNFLGHMINDAVGNLFDVDKCNIKNNDEIQVLERYIKNIFVRYFIEGKNKMNCRIRHSNYITYVETTREIEAGEELLTLYDISYWYFKTYNKSCVDILKNLLLHDKNFREWCKKLDIFN